MKTAVRLWALTSLLLAAIPTIGAQQKPTTLPGAISGTVVDGATAAPIAAAIVTLAAQPGSTSPLPPDYQSRQFTDPKGRFAFLNLPDRGEFRVSAAKSGYLDGGYGRESAPTDPLRTITLGSSNWVGGLRVTLWPPSSVAGTVRDENGEPVVGVFVRVLARIRIGGRDELAAGPMSVTDDRGQYRISGLLPGRYIVQVPSTQMSVPVSTRLPGPGTNSPEGAIDIDDSTRLIIGRYPLPPPAVNGRTMTYPSAFHPNGSTPGSAATVEVKFGDGRDAIDVSLTPTPAVRVSGVVEGPTEALAGLTLRLLPTGMENLGLGGDAATALVASNGSFTFVNVPPGSYTLDAPITFNQYSMASGATMTGGTVGSRGASTNLPPPPPRGGSSSSSQSLDGVPGVNLQTMDYRGASGPNVPKYTARMPITVPAGDLTGVVVSLRANAVLRGRMTVDADPARPTNAPSVTVILDPATGQPGLGTPRVIVRPGTAPDFELTGVQPGEYFLRVPSQAGWIVKSIEWRSRDYTSMPFDATNTDDISGVTVTITNRVASIGGTVHAADGTTAESAVVVIFPAQASFRQNAGLFSPRFASAAVGSTGAYRFGTLPAGDYCVAAVDRARLANWRDPAFLATLERQAARVTLDWGQSGAQDLTVVNIR